MLHDSSKREADLAEGLHALLLAGPAGLHTFCFAADLQSEMLLQKLFLHMVMSCVHSALCSHPVVWLDTALHHNVHAVATSEHTEFKCGGSASQLLLSRLQSALSVSAVALQRCLHFSNFILSLTVVILHCCSCRGDFRAD